MSKFFRIVLVFLIGAGAGIYLASQDIQLPRWPDILAWVQKEQMPAKEEEAPARKEPMPARKEPAPAKKEPAPARKEPVPPPASIEGKALLMHYMPWYKTPDVRGSWGSHWTGHQRQHDPDQTGEDGLPDIWSHYHPLIGLYDSTDRDVLECQLLQMKLAGVDGVVADWYGIAPHADYPEIHAATLALFAAAREAGMWFAVCYEDRSIQLLVDWESCRPIRRPSA